jgi:ribonuclease E
MTKTIIVDATHAEETRTAVVEDGRIIDFDYESNIRQQLKGSIFLAKVTRVEPSLQASFVNFGGERHGFLPFNEIHPDYFKIPVADRQAIIAEQKAYMDAMAAKEEAADLEEEADDGKKDNTEEEAEAPEEAEILEEGTPDLAENDASENDSKESDEQETSSEEGDDDETTAEDPDADDSADAEGSKKQNNNGRKGRNNYRGRGRGKRASMDSRKVEVVGGDVIDDDHAPRPTLRKNYKIQEVVKRGQIMLVQAQKEERGNKGAAVTTYISLPGRYCVLMPNSPRGGGVSRKVANYKERKRMREILKELNVPEGMSVILRTAGVARNKTEIKRDLDYLMRLWDDIRALTLESIAPACVYEEGSLIKRCIRDIYTRDVEEVVVAGGKTFQEAKKFMKMLIPSHSKKVVEYKDDLVPLFTKFKVESQLTAMGTPEADLKSGGSIVINPTEALVAIDVNSGRATKERHIEETALRTNLEAAEEVARQLKLRDLGGLIVIDFIDMENYRNNAKVERRLKECLSSDRARIQIGRISTFGLLEMSRQRLNPSMTEAQFKLCNSCKGLGYTRTTDSTAIIALRTIEEYAINNPNQKTVTLTVNNKVALFILNNKRDLLTNIEQRHACKIALQVDDSLAPAEFLINDKAPAVEKSQAKPEQKGKKPNRNNNRNKQRNNNRNNNNPNQNQNQEDKPNEQSSQGTTPADVKPDNTKQENTSEKAPEGKEDTVEEAPKKRRGRRPAKAKTEEAPAAAEVSETNDAPANDDKKEKPAPKAKKAKAPAKPRVKKEKVPVAEAPKNAEVKVVTAAMKEEKVAEVPVDKDYEKVNEAPTKKKKGWWSKG